MRYFTEEQVRQLLDPKEVIHALREAFTRDYATTLRMPVRARLDLGNGGVLLLMPAHDPALRAAGIKTVTVTPQSGVLATYQLLHPDTGRILALIEANYLTELRTAAASALAPDLLPRLDVETLRLF